MDTKQKNKMEDFVSKIVDAYPQMKYSLLDAQTFSQAHYGFPEIYYKMMETDQTRVNAFRDTFTHFDNLKDAVVCEAGVGTLALTRHYLPYVKKAYLIEMNPNVTDFVKEELKKNGWEDKTEFIVGDALKTTLPEPVDFIIGELMSIYCANEYQVQIFKHLRQFLKPDGKLIPEKILNMAQLGYAEFEDDHKHYPIMFTRHWPSMLSSLELVNEIDLYKEEKMDVSSFTAFRALLSGEVNCVMMNSLVQLTEGINFTGTDSLMPPTVLKLAEPISVKAGEIYILDASFSYGTSLDDAVFKLKKR